MRILDPWSRETTSPSLVSKLEVITVTTKGTYDNGTKYSLQYGFIHIVSLYEVA